MISNLSLHNNSVRSHAGSDRKSDSSSKSDRKTVTKFQQKRVHKNVQKFNRRSRLKATPFRRLRLLGRDSDKRKPCGAAYAILLIRDGGMGTQRVQEEAKRLRPDGVSNYFTSCAHHQLVAPTTTTHHFLSQKSIGNV